MIPEALVSAVTEAVFSHLAEKAEPKIRQWLGREPARLAFKTALLRALERFADRHSEWVEAVVRREESA